MSNNRTREYLVRIAKFVGDYPMIRRTDIQAWMSSVETPAQAMAHAANAVPAEERDAVFRALPRIQTDDFAEAARQIRQALTDDEIRALVRAKLADGTLPREAPSVMAARLQPSGQVPSETITIGGGLSDVCAACGRTSTEFRYPDGLAFHNRCHEIWRAEAEKLW